MLKCHTDFVPAYLIDIFHNCCLTLLIQAQPDSIACEWLNSWGFPVSAAVL